MESSLRLKLKKKNLSCSQNKLELRNRLRQLCLLNTDTHRRVQVGTITIIIFPGGGGGVSMATTRFAMAYRAGEERRDEGGCDIVTNRSVYAARSDFGSMPTAKLVWLLDESEILFDCFRKFGYVVRIAVEIWYPDSKKGVLKNFSGLTTFLRDTKV